MNKNSNKSAAKINVELLKNNLLGKSYDMKKGVKLEEIFNYMIQQKDQGGDCLQNIDSESIIFNNKDKIPRTFEVDMVGIIKISKDNNINEANKLNTRETSNSSKEKNIFEFNLLNYSFCPKIDKKYELKYEDINIKYNVKKLKIISNNNIQMDLCQKLKEIGKNKDSESKSSNIFERARANINKKEYDIDYVNKIVEFYGFLKNEFNAGQSGYPNLIKFAKLKTDSENKNYDLFFFHSVFKRELDGAYKVIKEYNFLEVSKLKEIKIDDSSNSLFHPGDILLFELKDSVTSNIALDCIKNNYKVINGFISILKKKKEFQNCNFYYIGIQEEDEEPKKRKKNVRL